MFGEKKTKIKLFYNLEEGYIMRQSGFRILLIYFIITGLLIKLKSSTFNFI